MRAGMGFHRGRHSGRVAVGLLASALLFACGTLSNSRGWGQDAWGPAAPGDAGVPGVVRSAVGIVTDYDATHGRLTLEGGATYLLPMPVGTQQLPGGLMLPPRVGETVRLTYIEQGSRKVIRFLEAETPQNNM